MDKKNIIAAILLCLPLIASTQIDFSDYFDRGSLRFDFLLGGNYQEVKAYPEQIIKEPFWGGSEMNLIDPFRYGTYQFKIFDVKSDSLIFSKGFSTLFQEWQTTAEAKTTYRTFYQAVRFPFPRKKVKLEINARQWEGNFKKIYETEIDPSNYFIIDEGILPYETFEIQNMGIPENKVDLVILAEGYNPSEKQKFVEDAKRVTGYLFNEEPFKSERDKFNVRAVFTPSRDSGTDVPGENTYKNTFFNSTFYTFDLPRYLTTSDMENVYDAASTVPYDQIYLLVNTERYGGGGFYNFISVCSADHSLTPKVFTHEFGHGFAGLGDEYYNSDVAYENFYNLETEPWEPNLTTLVDFSSKWESMVDDSTAIPTPAKVTLNKTIGGYEGGGYKSKGIFRPYINCRMKSNKAEGFCPVCAESIKKVIRFYTE